jgi:hypothetical protein
LVGFGGGTRQLLGCLQLPITSLLTGDRQYRWPGSPGASTCLGNRLAIRLKVAHRSIPFTFYGRAAHVAPP